MSKPVVLPEGEKVPTTAFLMVERILENHLPCWVPCFSSASEMNVVAPVEKCWECDGREEVAGIGVGSDSA